MLNELTNPEGLGISGSVFSLGRNKGIPKLAEISKPDLQRKATTILILLLTIELTNPEGLGISGSVFSLGRNKGIPNLAEISKPDSQLSTILSF